MPILICLAPAEDYEPPKDVRLRAEFAWNMLRSWKKPPGVADNGAVDRDKLRAWVERARQLAAKADRLDVADQEIGKVLFYFPSDPDDSIWPHVELRELLETLQSERVENGIELEQVNSRGVVTKAVFEGGTQERQLAQKWRDMAEKLGFRWPRTRAMLERIASYWETDAKHEDDRAEKRRLQLGKKSDAHSIKIPFEPSTGVEPLLSRSAISFRFARPGFVTSKFPLRFNSLQKSATSE